MDASGIGTFGALCIATLHRRLIWVNIRTRGHADAEGHLNPDTNLSGQGSMIAAWLWRISAQRLARRCKAGHSNKTNAAVGIEMITARRNLAVGLATHGLAALNNKVANHHIVTDDCGNRDNRSLPKEHLPLLHTHPDRYRCRTVCCADR
ncbi:MAG: hypothetical protein WBB98_03260 [Xanthobacteraceae bacterium]